MEAWGRLYGITLKTWELRALLAMDRSYLQRCGELSKPEKEQVVNEPLTPAVFDRLFKV